MTPARSASTRLLKAVAALFFVSLLSAPSSADTIYLSNQQEIKGLVVEEHEDRIILSTVDGERQLFRKDISRIDYDGLEYNLLSLGREAEKQKHWQEALSYYERALQINPELEEAKQAALGLKSRLWTQMVDEGPKAEVSKVQDLHDSWVGSVDIEALGKKHHEDQAKLLWDRLGVKLAVRNDWVVADNLRIGGYLAKRGLKNGDEFVSIDGKSMRFLNADAVTGFLLEPRYSSASVVVGRAVTVAKPRPGAALKELGFRVSQEYNGLTVADVSSSGLSGAKLRAGDIITDIGKTKTRYEPQKDAVRLLEDPKNAEIELMIHRSITIARK